MCGDGRWPRKVTSLGGDTDRKATNKMAHLLEFFFIAACVKFHIKHAGCNRLVVSTVFTQPQHLCRICRIISLIYEPMARVAQSVAAPPPPTMFNTDASNGSLPSASGEFRSASSSPSCCFLPRRCRQGYREDPALRAELQAASVSTQE